MMAGDWTKKWILAQLPVGQLDKHGQEKCALFTQAYDCTVFFFNFSISYLLSFSPVVAHFLFAFAHATYLYVAEGN